MQPHDYDPIGGLCRCGKTRYHAEHYAGNPVKAAAAYHQARDDQLAIEIFRENLQVGTPVVLLCNSVGRFNRDDQQTFGRVHGFQDSGNVSVIGRSGTIYRDHRRHCIYPLPGRPEFSSFAEAEEWLDEMTERIAFDVVPHFASTEQAQEWLDQQAELQAKMKRTG